MRGRLLNMPAIGKAAGLALVAAAIIAAAIHLRHGLGSVGRMAARPTTWSSPLNAELARCQSIGLAAQNDAACEAAWTENRRRFFTYRDMADGDQGLGMQLIHSAKDK